MVGRGPADLRVVLIDVESKLWEVDILLTWVAPVAPDDVMPFAPDGHVDSAAASFRALGLGNPNLVRRVCRVKRRKLPQQIPRVMCRALVEHVGQDVSSVDDRSTFHGAVPASQRWHDDAEGQQMRFCGHWLMVSESVPVVLGVST
ncbi:hypothetical protein VO63_22100 [Streptomyces showdoensis]|uniref:Uncharacterized protein n=1 Tax=Streptomyces showdoensis TaxID=68268 RepID=A0A2P2GJL0_STREW|nr:hypothetical protein VO63_22100 [Streptomyces showdoensis]